MPPGETDLRDDAAVPLGLWYKEVPRGPVAKMLLLFREEPAPWLSGNSSRGDRGPLGLKARPASVPNDACACLVVLGGDDLLVGRFNVEWEVRSFFAAEDSSPSKCPSCDKMDGVPP